MKTAKVEKLDDLDIAMRVLRDFFDEHGATIMVAKKLDESLSERQRGYYWSCLKPLADHMGHTVEELHEQYKESLWLNLYVADPENHPTIYNAVAAMKSIKNDVPAAQYQSIRKFIVDEVSHLDATWKNMADALKRVEIDAGGLGVALPQPPSRGLVGEDSKFYRSR